MGAGGGTGGGGRADAVVPETHGDWVWRVRMRGCMAGGVMCAWIARATAGGGCAGCPGGVESGEGVRPVVSRQSQVAGACKAGSPRCSNDLGCLLRRNPAVLLQLNCTSGSVSPIRSQAVNETQFVR